MPLRTLEAQDGILRMSSEVRFTLSIHSFCPADRSLFVPAALISRERFNFRLLDDQRFSCLVAYFSAIGKNPARGFIVTIGKHQTEILFLIFLFFFGWFRTLHLRPLARLVPCRSLVYQINLVICVSVSAMRTID
jgi:hypothetical protein